MKEKYSQLLYIKIEHLFKNFTVKMCAQNDMFHFWNIGSSRVLFVHFIQSIQLYGLLYQHNIRSVSEMLCEGIKMYL